jgi:starch phosphorylase
MEDTEPIPKLLSSEVRPGFDVQDIKRDILDNLFYLQGKFPEVATSNDWYQAVAHTIRDRLMSVWVRSAHEFYLGEVRTVCYLSAEFLIGPQLAMNLLRRGIHQAVENACDELGVDLDVISQCEDEPGLGSGGLGRLAACHSPGAHDRVRSPL